MDVSAFPFEFGVYAGGASGTDLGMTVSGPPDDTGKIKTALDNLQGSASSFLVRCYAGYHGPNKAPRTVSPQPELLTSSTRKLDLVLCFQSDEDDMDGWKEFITMHIIRYGQQIKYLQITEEANLNLPALDGHYSYSRKALVEGIVHAKSVIGQNGFDISVGFNATPDFNPNRTFWKEIKSLARANFYQSLDYVGLDFFPGVFRPLPSMDYNEVHRLISTVIDSFRNDIEDAGIVRNIPIHITENGFPTQPGNPEKQQSEVLSMKIRILFELRVELNIRTYELFSLRDSDSSVPDLFYQFGIMRDDYSPKQAFETVRDLIRRFSMS